MDPLLDLSQYFLKAWLARIIQGAASRMRVQVSPTRWNVAQDECLVSSDVFIVTLAEALLLVVLGSTRRGGVADL